MKSEDIENLIALANKASPGPWEYTGKEYGDDGGVHYAVSSSNDEEVIGEYGPSYEDTRYIAAANPTAILSIINKNKNLVRENLELTRVNNEQRLQENRLETALNRYRNNHGMADCMQMVRDDLAEVGLISNKTAPMFIVDEILANVSYLSMVESTLMKFIDRMNDHCKEDPAEKILDEFCAKISPIFEQNLKRKRK